MRAHHLHITEKECTTKGVTDGAGNDPVTGYSVLQADSLDAAVKLAQGCPHLKDGGTVEVYETIEM